MHILDKIVAYKKEEVQRLKLSRSLTQVMDTQSYCRNGISMCDHLLDPSKSGIIAEFKRKSPSKSDINLNASITQVTQGYSKAGASGISVLTDQHFFGAKPDDIFEARESNDCPILRKDFIIDSYQIHEAKSMGADLVLLISEILDKEQIFDLAAEAKSIGLEVLMEVHSERQLEKYCKEIDIVGVNNRNLDTFQVDIQNSINLVNAIPNDALKISESGISNVNSILRLKDAGYQGFLIGEHFMASSNPEIKCKEFINQINTSRENIGTNI